MIKTKSTSSPLQGLRYHGSTTSDVRISFLWYQIPAVATASIRMQSFCVTPDTATTTSRKTATHTTTKKKMPTQSPNTEYRERRNHYDVFDVNASVDGFETDRDSFLGAYGENSAPSVVVNDQSKNSVASGWAPVGSHHLKVALEPGEESPPQASPSSTASLAGPF